MLGALRRYRRKLEEDRLKAQDGELNSLIAILQTRVYNATYEIYQDQECKEKIHGSGHHMAQQIAGQAAKLLHERWIPTTQKQGGKSRQPNGRKCLHQLLETGDVQ